MSIGGIVFVAVFRRFMPDFVNRDRLKIMEKIIETTLFFLEIKIVRR